METNFSPFQERYFFWTQVVYIDSFRSLVPCIKTEHDKEQEEAIKGVFKSAYNKLGPVK